MLSKPAQHGCAGICHVRSREAVWYHTEINMKSFEMPSGDGGTPVVLNEVTRFQLASTRVKKNMLIERMAKPIQGIANARMPR